MKRLFLEPQPLHSPSPTLERNSLWCKTDERETTHLGVKFHFCAKQLGVDGHQLSVPVMEVTLNITKRFTFHNSMTELPHVVEKDKHIKGALNIRSAQLWWKHSPTVCRFQQLNHDASCSLEGPAKETNWMPELQNQMLTELSLIKPFHLILKILKRAQNGNKTLTLYTFIYR